MKELLKKYWVLLVAFLLGAFWLFGLPLALQKDNIGNITSPRPTPSQGSDTVFGNATTTKLYVSGTTNLAGALTFTTASGTSITSTNASFTTITLPGGVKDAVICWKNTSTLGYCSSVVGVTGLCTCN